MIWKPLLHKLARAVARPFRAAGDFLIVDLRTVFKNFGEHDGELSTCALAFFLLISFIPISLVIIATMSFFYDSDSLVSFYITQLKSQLPSIDIDRFIAIIDKIIFKKRYLAFIWVPFLFWWGSFVFDIIERGLEKAFRIGESRRYWKSKLRHFLIILGMAFFIVVITMFSNFMVILKNAGIALLMERNLSEYGIMNYLVTAIERIPLLLSSVMTLLAERDPHFHYLPLRAAEKTHPTGRSSRARCSHRSATRSSSRSSPTTSRRSTTTPRSSAPSTRSSS